MIDCLWIAILVLILVSLGVRPTYSACGKGVQYHTADKYGIPNFFYSPSRQSDQNNQYCQWQIKSTESDRIIGVRFTIMHTDNQPSCQMHNISIYDGPDGNSTRLGVICGDDNTLGFESSSIYMYIVFQTNQHGNYTGFICEYVSKATPKPTNRGGGTMGATMGSIAAGSLVIGAICCCCFKKGMKGRAIKPSTTFRFGNRGLFSSTTTTSIAPSARQSNNPRTAVLAASINTQSVYNVRSNNVTFNNSPLSEADPPPTYSSLEGCPQTNQVSDSCPPAYSSLPTNPAEPPRYSTMSRNVIPTISETQKHTTGVTGAIPSPAASVDNGEVKLQLRPRKKDLSTEHKEESWSPPPPYEYHT